MYKILKGDLDSPSKFKKKLHDYILDLRNVPGGAGLVKRIADRENLYYVLKNALDRVRNCTCGKETSCYGCLRNYQNQFCHEILRRDIVWEFLEQNLGEESYA